MAYGLATMQRERRLHIRRGEPIRECGVDLYPITMDHYEDFIQCKDALTLRLSSLPVKYVSLDYLSAIFALELDLISSGGDPNVTTGGMFFRLMRLFGLSLRIEMTVELMNQSIFYRAANGNISIEYMEFTQPGADGNPNTAKITPFQFSSILRPLIAAQNQIVLPDESENADLVSAYELKKQIEQRGVALKTDLDDLVSAVAYKSGVSDAEIMDWNVRDFENRRRAIERDMRHQLYAQAEMSGMVTFKNGNPYPSWCFDAADDTLGTMEYAELAKTLSGAAAPGAGIPG